MFKIQQVEITGFWGSKKVNATFNDSVNIIIGQNGTGKTTFMNILQSILTVDPEGLYENSFDSAKITLSDGVKRRTIRAERKEMKNLQNFPFPVVEYHISNRAYSLPLYFSDESRPMPVLFKKRSVEEIQRIRNDLEQFVSVSSLSVHRAGLDLESDIRDRPRARIISAVDSRLGFLINKLTQYQLELSDQARQVSAALQKDVLTSLLYASKDKEKLRHYPVEFDEENERTKLTAAYKQLGLSGSDVLKKIHDHSAAVASAVKNLAELRNKSSLSSNKQLSVDIGALEALVSTQNVVRMSLNAEVKTAEIFKQTRLFTETLAEFIKDKVFEFVSGSLIVKSPKITIQKLSSGEKQLLILMIETLLQRQVPYIFLADEPELSLHISWQRNVISAIKKINPNAQIIVATHSPEVAGKFRGSLLDMEDLTHA